MFAMNGTKHGPKLVKPGGVLSPGWRLTLADVGRQLVWSPRGDALFVGDATGAVQALAASSGALLWQTKEHRGGVLAMAIHTPAQGPSRGLVSTGEDGLVVFHDVATGAVTARHDLGSRWVEHAAWSPTGTMVAVAIGKDVHLFTAEGQALGELGTHPATVAGLAWSPSGELFTACYGQVAVWDPLTRRASTRYECESPPLCLVASHDGSVLASGSQDCCVYFWRRENGQKSAMYGYARKPAVVCFGAESRWLATTGGETPLIWSFEDGGPEGTEPLPLQVHTLPVTALVAAQSRSVLATGGRDGGVVIWKVAGLATEIVGFALCEQPIERLAFRPDDQALAGLTRDGHVEVWRCRTNKV